MPTFIFYCYALTWYQHLIGHRHKLWRDIPFWLTVYYSAAQLLNMTQLLLETWIHTSFWMSGRLDWLDFTFMNGVGLICGILWKPQQLCDIVTKATVRRLIFLIYCRMATAASIFDFPDETDRLLTIQNIAEVALQASETALCNVNVSKS